jgi:alpha-1,2-mannosyltransferase
MAVSATTDTEDPLKKALTHALVIWAIVAPILVLGIAALHGQFALDFRHAFLPASRSVIHGMSPYSPVGSRRVVEGTAFLYPPLSAYLLAPFTLLPPLVAELLAVALVAAAVPATLWVLGVRDWRCYALAFLWWPTIIGIGTANLTLPMLLLLALVWRYRHRTVVAAVLTGLVVALKLLFWPLLFWLVATRRYRSAALAALASGVFIVLPWAGIGFAGVRGYPHLLATISRSEGPRNYSVASLLHAMLPSWGASTAIETALGAVVLALVLVVGRRGRDRDAFALGIVAALVFTPLLEMHYLAALLVVVAIYQRQFGLAWLAPLLIWGAPGSGPGSPIQTVHVLVVASATVALAITGWTWDPRSRWPGSRLSKGLASPGRKGAGPSLAPP